MRERSKYLTVIFSEPTQEEASELIRHPTMAAASWSHAINDRAAKDAEIARLRDGLAQIVAEFGDIPHGHRAAAIAAAALGPAAQTPPE